jgi:hypothetical protein
MVLRVEKLEEENNILKAQIISNEEKNNFIEANYNSGGFNEKKKLFNNEREILNSFGENDNVMMDDSVSSEILKERENELEINRNIISELKIKNQNLEKNLKKNKKESELLKYYYYYHYYYYYKFGYR